MDAGIMESPRWVDYGFPNLVCKLQVLNMEATLPWSFLAASSLNLSYQRFNKDMLP